MRALLALLLLAQVVSYPPGSAPVRTFPPQPVSAAAPCLANSFPSPVIGRAVALSSGYPLLAKYVVEPTDFWGNPPNTATEAVLDPNGNYPPLGTYAPVATASTTFAAAGSYAPTLGYRNCFTNDFVGVFAEVYNGGWSPGDPEPVVFHMMLYELQVDPDPSGNIAGAIITPGGATNVAVWQDAVGAGTLLYSGTVAGLSAAVFSLGCPGGNKPLYYVFTNGAASTTVAGVLSIQDNIGLCPVS